MLRADTDALSTGFATRMDKARTSRRHADRFVKRNSWDRAEKLPAFRQAAASPYTSHRCADASGTAAK
nr:hypothetical protein GCM10023233_08640 [Brevibacterium otitidis]